MTIALMLLGKIWDVLKSLPWWVYALAIAVLYHISAIHVAEARATDECNAKWQKQEAALVAKQQAEVAELRAKQQEVITRTVIEYRDRVKVIHEKAAEVTKDIQAHVGVDDPVLPGWVRHYFDLAATDCDVPTDTGGAACSSFPVAASTVTQTAANNFELCRADQERLAKLQDLVRSLAAPAPAK